MIILSAVLVIVAIALLALGLVIGGHTLVGLSGLQLVYVSIGVSIVSAVCLVIWMILRRQDLFGPAPAASAARPARANAPRRAMADMGARPTSAGAKPEMATAVATMAAAEVPGDAIVYVVTGRKRYHLETCRQLAGREKSELTYEEAREEGFSACSACMPDTALAARAAAHEAASTPAKVDPKDPPEDATDTATLASTADLDAKPAASDPLGDGTDTDRDRPGIAPLPGKPAEPEATTDLTSPTTATTPLDKQASAAGVTPLGGAAARPDKADEAEQADDDGESEAPAEPVRILAGTKRYHRAGCALIKGIDEEGADLELLSRKEARAKGSTPCLVCQPDRAAENAD